MARYIDADALIEQMEADAEHMDDCMAKMMLYASINDVKHAPTADVVEVVRCKDCKYNPKLLKREQTSYWKPCDELFPNDKYYCWCGERRKE